MAHCAIAGDRALSHILSELSNLLLVLFVDPFQEVCVPVLLEYLIQIQRLNFVRLLLIIVELGQFNPLLRHLPVVMALHLIVILDLYGVDRDCIEPLCLVKRHDFIVVRLIVALVVIHPCQVRDVLIFLKPKILRIKHQNTSLRLLPFPLGCGGSLLLRVLLALHGRHHHSVSIRALKVT